MRVSIRLGCRFDEPLLHQPHLAGASYQTSDFVLSDIRFSIYRLESLLFGAKLSLKWLHGDASEWQQLAGSTRSPKATGKSGQQSRERPVVRCEFCIYSSSSHIPRTTE